MSRIPDSMSRSNRHQVLIADLEKLAEVLKRRAVEFKYTPTIGRTHGVHAEPTAFGLKILLWYSETLRNIERMKRTITERKTK